MKIQIEDRSADVYLEAYYPKGSRGGDPLPAVLICPGGGYRLIGTTEGRPMADKFNDEGYAAFVLNYTVGEAASFGEDGFAGFAPLLDLKAAMRLLSDKAEEYGIDKDNILLAGFSAGGHLTAAYCFSVHGATTAGEGSAPLPRALILTYAMGGGRDSGGDGKPQPDYEIAGMDYSSDKRLREMPVFFWHARDDEMVPFAVSERLEARLSKENIIHKFVPFEHGIHARPLLDPSWFALAMDWLKENM